MTEKSLTENERRFVELDRQKAEHRQFFDELNAAATAVAEEKGIGHAFQDEEGIVYQVQTPRDRFVEYHSTEIVHTRRPTEVKGSLSIVGAKQLGFEPLEPPTPKALEKAQASAEVSA